MESGESVCDDITSKKRLGNIKTLIRKNLSAKKDDQESSDFCKSSHNSFYEESAPTA